MSERSERRALLETACQVWKERTQYDLTIWRYGQVTQAVMAAPSILDYPMDVSAPTAPMFTPQHITFQLHFEYIHSMRGYEYRVYVDGACIVQGLVRHLPKLARLAAKKLIDERERRAA